MIMKLVGGVLFVTTKNQIKYKKGGVGKMIRYNPLEEKQPDCELASPQIIQPGDKKCLALKTNTLTCLSCNRWRGKEWWRSGNN